MQEVCTTRIIDIELDLNTANCENLSHARDSDAEVPCGSHSRSLPAPRQQRLGDLWQSASAADVLPTTIAASMVTTSTAVGSSGCPAGLNGPYETAAECSAAVLACYVSGPIPFCFCQSIENECCPDSVCRSFCEEELPP